MSSRLQPLLGLVLYLMPLIILNNTNNLNQTLSVKTLLVLKVSHMIN